MTVDAWDPVRYQRFGDERRQPFYELLGLVRSESPAFVVDLGCGSGELTAELHRRWPRARVVGVDSSAAMLNKAAAHAGAGLEFVQGDISDWQPDAPVDVLFSNAALQWVPNHETLLPRLVDMLAPSGEMAVQMPANFDHPSHRIAAEVAARPEFTAALHGYRRTIPVLPPERYAAMLHELGCAEQHVRLQVYGHILESTAAIVEWTSGTLLTAYESRLPPEAYQRFVDVYRAQLLAELGDQRPYFYAFKRLLFGARWDALESAG